MLKGQALTVAAEVHRDRGEIERAHDLAEQAARIQAATGHHPGKKQADAIAEQTRRAVPTGPPAQRRA